MAAVMRNCCLPVMRVTQRGNVDKDYKHHLPLPTNKQKNLRLQKGGTASAIVTFSGIIT